MLLMKHLLYLLILSLLFSFCKNKQDFYQVKSFEVEIIDSISIEVPINGGYGFDMSLYEQNDSIYCVLQDLNETSIHILNLTSRKYAGTVSLKKYADKHYQYPVFHFIALNEDSLIFVDMPINFSFNHDSAFRVINSHGEMIGALIWQNELSDYWNSINESQGTPYFYMSFSETEHLDGSIYFPMRNVKVYNNDSSYFSTYQHFGGNLNYSDSANKFNPHTFQLKPDDQQKATWNKSKYFNWQTIPNQDGRVVYLFNFADDIIVYNSHTHESQRFEYPRPVLIDLFYKHYEGRIESEHFYDGGFFDFQNSYFIRLGVFPKISEMNKLDYHFFSQKTPWLGLYDDSFNLIAESVGDSSITWIYPKPKSFKNKLYAVKRSYGKYNVTIYELKINVLDEPATLPDRIHQFSITEKLLLKNYLEENVHCSDCFVLVVPNSSCPSCIIYVLEVYITNQSHFKEKNLFLISEESTINRHMDYFSESDIAMMHDNKYIIVEKRDSHLSNLEDGIFGNPFIVHYVDGKVRSKFIFNPDDLNLLMEFDELFKD